MNKYQGKEIESLAIDRTVYMHVYFYETGKTPYFDAFHDLTACHQTGRVIIGKSLETEFLDFFAPILNQSPFAFSHYLQTIIEHFLRCQISRDSSSALPFLFYSFLIHFLQGCQLRFVFTFLFAMSMIEASLK